MSAPPSAYGWTGYWKACRDCGTTNRPEIEDGLCGDCAALRYGPLGLADVPPRWALETTPMALPEPTPIRPLTALPAPDDEADAPWKRQLAEIAPSLPEGDAEPSDAELAAIDAEERADQDQPTPAAPWHKLYDQCLNCGKTDEPQHQRGICKPCYLAWNAASFNDRKAFTLGPAGMTRHSMADAVAGKAIALADDPGYRVTTPDQVTALITLGRESRMHGLVAFASAPKVATVPPAEPAASAPQAPSERVRLVSEGEAPVPVLTLPAETPAPVVAPSAPALRARHAERVTIYRFTCPNCGYRLADPATGKSEYREIGADLVLACVPPSEGGAGCGARWAITAETIPGEAA